MGYFYSAAEEAGRSSLFLPLLCLFTLVSQINAPTQVHLWRAMCNYQLLQIAISIRGFVIKKFSLRRLDLCHESFSISTGKRNWIFLFYLPTYLSICYLHPKAYIYRGCWRDTWKGNYTVIGWMHGLSFSTGDLLNRLFYNLLFRSSEHLWSPTILWRE